MPTIKDWVWIIKRVKELTAIVENSKDKERVLDAKENLRFIEAYVAVIRNRQSNAFDEDDNDELPLGKMSEQCSALWKTKPRTNNTKKVEDKRRKNEKK